MAAKKAIFTLSGKKKTQTMQNYNTFSRVFPNIKLLCSKLKQTPVVSIYFTHLQLIFPE
jgi:hypothetical protein